MSERLFDFGAATDAALVDEMAQRWRAEARDCAARYAAMAELFERRRFDHAGRELWLIDQAEAVAAEVSAALRITPSAAHVQLGYATALRTRLPKVAALFSAGDISIAMAQTIVKATALAVDPEIIASIDAEIAAQIATWGPLSKAKTEQALDAIVDKHDPDAVRRFASKARDRNVTFEPKPKGGLTGFWGQLFATDAAVLQRRLKLMARGVCAADGRTVEQREADALGALAAGMTVLPCACGQDACPAAAADAGPAVHIHVVAEEIADPDSTVELHGDVESDTRVDTREGIDEVLDETFAPDPEKPPKPASKADKPKPGFVFGGMVVPGTLLSELVRTGLAKVIPLVVPSREAPAEDRYRPSKALADFVRCRDMFCRFPGCRRPADVCEIDHTVAHPVGPTHASNLKCLCKTHHLLKTFWLGKGGWSDKQLPDGIVIWTSPTGHEYTTQPGSRLALPRLCASTGELVIAESPAVPRSDRGRKMPKRTQTRERERARRIADERKRPGG